MCVDPVTLGIISVGLAAAGTVVTAVGQVQAGKAARKQSEFNAQVSRNNAILAERQASDSLRRGRLSERQKRLQLAKLSGSQRAAFAANNVAINQGSPLDVLEFGAEQGELEALSIRSAAERQAVGFRARAGNLEAEASLFEAAGRQQETAGFFAAASTILSGASKTAGLSSKFG